MDGYIRVSKVGERTGEFFISPTVQRETIEGWAALRGVEIAAWHEDLDQLGGNLDRPGLSAMLERIESNETEGVVVAKLDRLSRFGAADTLKLVERIADAGGSIAAVDLGLDPTTPFGEFGMTMMLAMARMERRRLSDAWGDAKSRAMDRGAKIGPTPFGYRRRTDESRKGELEPDPEQAPIIAEAYRLAAQDGVEAARAHLLQAAPERASNNYTTRRLLARRCYIGESHYGGRVVRGAHPALVDRATWEAAQHGPTVRHRARAMFPLSGITVCGSCGSAMIGHRSGYERVRAYRCGARCKQAASTRAEPLEGIVREELRRLCRAGWTHGGGDADVKTAEKSLLEAEAELDAFASDLTARRLLGGRYHDHLQARADAVQAAHAAYRAEASKQVRQGRVFPAELLDSKDPAELREVFSAGLAAVIVQRGRGPIAGRVQLLFQGQDQPARILVKFGSSSTSTERHRAEGS
jgi:DNA invertase Pin-like site-specific DNA recombinase